MTWTVDTSGTTTLTAGGTEDVLVSGSTTNATYVFKADLHNLANGEIVTIRIYTKVLTGDTLRPCWQGTSVGGAGTNNLVIPDVISPPIASDFSVKVTAQQQNGTGRSVTWSLLRI